jgi:hypothetical protein
MSDDWQALMPKQQILESLSRLPEDAGYDEAIKRIRPGKHGLPRSSIH